MSRLCAAAVPTPDKRATPAGGPFSTSCRAARKGWRRPRRRQRAAREELQPPIPEHAPHFRPKRHPFLPAFLTKGMRYTRQPPQPVSKVVSKLPHVRPRCRPIMGPHPLIGLVRHASGVVSTDPTVAVTAVGHFVWGRADAATAQPRRDLLDREAAARRPSPTPRAAAGGGGFQRHAGGRGRGEVVTPPRYACYAARRRRVAGGARGRHQAALAARRHHHASTRSWRSAGRTRDRLEGLEGRAVRAAVAVCSALPRGPRVAARSWAAPRALATGRRVARSRALGGKHENADNEWWLIAGGRSRAGQSGAGVAGAER